MTTTDYGEGFLPIGIGYYHQSLTDSIEPNTTDASDPIQQQLSFVAADGRNTIISDADTATSANANADAEAEAVAAAATTTAQLIVQQALSGNNDMAISKQLPPSEKSYETQLSSSIERDAHVARNKAMDIIRKIHQQSKQRGDAVQGSNIYLTSCHPKRKYDTGDDTERERIQGITHTSLLSSTAKATATTEEETTMKITSTTVTTITTPPWELKQRRRDCLDRFEERIKRAFFKNLEHVSCIEEERLKHQIQNIDKAKTLEQQLQDRYDQRMEARQQQQRRRKNANNNNKNDINLCAAGIGTKQRNRAEKKRKQTALPSSLRNEQQNSRDSGGDKQSSSSSSSSVAIYVSCEGGSSPHGVVEEAILKALFESYGSIRKIHFYIDKKTGTKKGDALIIYSLQDGEDATSLAESVCSQVCTLQLQQ